jgi:hypothetical protein
MLLTEDIRVENERHTVMPLDEAKINGLFSFYTIVQFVVSECECGQWVAWPFPNLDLRNNSWEYTRCVRDDALVGAGKIGQMVGLSSLEGTSWAAPARWHIVSSFEELLFHVNWDAEPNRPASAVFQELSEKYGQHYGFVVARVNSPGHYAMAWRWWGPMPFVAHAWVAKQQDVFTAVVLNTHRLDWKIPGVCDNGPSRQNSCMDECGLAAVLPADIAPAVCAVSTTTLRDKRRNSDIVAQKMDWGSRRVHEMHNTGCALM